MENYKELNAELVAQVQKQKLEISEYRKGLIQLNAQLQEEHEKRVFERTRYEEEAKERETKLKCALSELMRSLNISTNSQQELHRIDKTLTPQAPPPALSTDGKRQSDRSSSSTKMCRELRHSSALSRHTIVLSPSRRLSMRRSSSSNNQSVEFIDSSSASEGEEEEENTEQQANPAGMAEAETLHSSPQPRRISELDVDINWPEEAEAVPQQQEDPAAVYLYSIQEEDSDSEDTSFRCAVQNPTSTQPMQTRRRAILNATESPLRDVTNRSIASPKTTARGSRKSPRIEAAKPTPSPHLTRTMSRMYEETDNENMSVQQARYVANLSPEAASFKNFGVATDLTLTPKRSSLELSYAQGIDNAPRSTPIACPRKSNSGFTKDDEEVVVVACRMASRGRKISRSKQISVTDSETSSETFGGRPSRSCRPKTLKEPSLGAKLRNETKENSLTKKRK
ncbi:shugoshin [Scaptodrosophila lebanonensis]|uniref:Shugoshin n=1 Tax=Drosophila lebanonensis TaxID=7225 RepID=A0A6J2TFE6_DROLE|nr:shugoshin [Scaptodrosophila lebanonensis]